MNGILWKINLRLRCTSCKCSKYPCCLHITIESIGMFSYVCATHAVLLLETGYFSRRVSTFQWNVVVQSSE